MRVVECPSSFATTMESLPACLSQLANVLRRSFGVTEGIFARVQARSSTLAVRHYLRRDRRASLRIAHLVRQRELRELLLAEPGILFAGTRHGLHHVSHLLSFRMGTRPASRPRFSPRRGRLEIVLVGLVDEAGEPRMTRRHPAHSTARTRWLPIGHSLANAFAPRRGESRG